MEMNFGVVGVILTFNLGNEISHESTSLGIEERPGGSGKRARIGKGDCGRRYG